MDKITRLKDLLKPIIIKAIKESMDTPSATGKTYYYSVLLNGKGKFHAEVTDVDGNVIFMVNKEDYFNYMSNPNDLISLKKYLVKIQKMSDGDELVPEY